MDEELQKRNTDCVYFLASPLTCKKGIECEYRHSENARLNPRDCWYWFTGNCLNPACSFRHPPLDGQPETSIDSVHFPSNLSVATTKPDVPCYFFFNTYCIKGDKCPFLHGPNNPSSGWKSAKAAPVVTDIYPVESKASVENDTRAAPVEASRNPSQRTSNEKNIQLQTKNVQVEVPASINEHSPSPRMPLTNHEEAAVKLSESPTPVEDYIDCSRRPHASEEQSSEEEDDESNNSDEPEERWESSPGFDVLVDDKSGHMGYEEDNEYLKVCDRDSGMVHNHLIHYEYEDKIAYNHMDYHDDDMLYDHGITDLYDRFNGDYPSDYVGKVPDNSREKMLESMMINKSILPRKQESHHQNRVDLRDHLKLRRRDVHNGFYGSNKRHFTSFCGIRMEPPVRRGTLHEYNGRFASEVGKDTIRSPSELNSGLRGSSRSGHLRHSRSRQNRQRQLNKRRRRQETSPSSRAKRSLTVKDAKPPMQESSAFTGPKTLAQIKEEKRKATIANSNFGLSSKVGSESFQGPKPLSELLKNKRTLVSANENSNSIGGKSDHDNICSVSLLGKRDEQLDGVQAYYRGANNRQLTEDDTDSLYDEDYDNDEFVRKIAAILD